MCGIIGYVGKEDCLNFLLDGLSTLEYRGYDSAGVAVINENKINIEKTLNRIKNLKEKCEKNKNIKGFIGLGHTRWATHGKVNESNAHPIISQNGDFCVVHNGIIENYAEIKRELINEGINFSGKTDTEVIPNLIKKYYKGDLLEAVNKAKNRLIGSYAVGIISLKEPEKIIAIKKLSPLVVGLSKDGNFISSDISAIAKNIKEVIYLEDGQTAVLTKEKTEIYDENLNLKKVKSEKVKFDVNRSNKNGFEDFMLKEIFEQPRVLKSLLERHIKNGKVVFDDISLKQKDFEKFNKIVITACGSAYNAGMVGKYVLEEILEIPVILDFASEFRYRNPVIDEKTLVFVISQSGETADTLSALKEAKRKGAHIISVVNVLSSSIAKESHDVIYTDAGPEIAVATTKGYLTQTAVLCLFAVFVASKLKKDREGQIKDVLEEVFCLPSKIQQIIDQKQRIKELAKEFKEEETVFFIGRNIDYAVCLEASLKFKEISYIHSESYPAGELKHGTISLIEEGKKVIALAYNDRILSKTVSNIKEVKSRGAQVLLFTKEGNQDIEKEADKIFYLPKTHEYLSACVEVIAFQLFAYYVAKLRGCDIDKPRNLAKSVTVE